MGLSIRCPNCDRQLRAPESVRGKWLNCPGCSSPVLVPAPAEPPPPGEKVFQLADGSVVPPEESPAPKPRRRIKKKPDDGKAKFLHDVLNAWENITKVFVVIALVSLFFIGIRSPETFRAIFSSKHGDTGQDSAAKVWVWRAFTSPDRDFTVDMPPGEVSHRVNILEGVTIANYGIDVDGGKYTFLVSRATIPPNRPAQEIDQLISQLRASFVRRHPEGGVKSEREAQLDGQPCKEIVIEKKRGGPKADLIVRACRRGQYVYYVAAGGLNFDAEADPVRRYFSSFKILQEAPGRP